MRREILRLDTQTARVEELNRQLKSKADSLKYDAKAIERLARERFGFAKSGEIVIKFEEAGFQVR